MYEGVISFTDTRSQGEVCTRVFGALGHKDRYVTGCLWHWVTMSGSVALFKALGHTGTVTHGDVVWLDIWGTECGTVPGALSLGVPSALSLRVR